MLAGCIHGDSERGYILKERFEGANRPNVVEALKRQELVSGNLAIAQALDKAGEVVEFDRDQMFIVQNDSANDIYLLLAGSVVVVANGAEVAQRKAGQHVGEMAAIEPSLPRAASVTAAEKTVGLKISSTDFLKIGETYPLIWMPMARELARRLHQRNSMIPQPNEAPKLFIISSSEAIAIAEAVRDGLVRDVFSTVWKEGVFFAGGYTLEALEAQVEQSDFAVAVAEPDDIVRSRGSTQRTMRDNVLFELGLFMGKLTRLRSILVHPRVKDLKLPSDLQGLTLVPYEHGDATTIAARIEPVCEQIRNMIKLRGVRTFTLPKPASSTGAR